jgi:hypothetical protein
MRPSHVRPSGVLATVIITCTSLGACADVTEPAPPPAPTLIDIRPPIVPLYPGVMVRICRPGKVGCVPTYAVPCRVESVGKNGPPVTRLPQLSPEAEAWCAAQPGRRGGHQSRPTPKVSRPADGSHERVHHGELVYTQETEALLKSGTV